MEAPRLPKLPVAFTFGVGAERWFVNDRAPSSSEGKGGKDFLSSPGREDSWAVYAEGGVVWRTLNNRVDLFAKIRGVKPLDLGNPASPREHVAILVGADVPLHFGK